MALRCLLFCSDEGTAAPILQALTGLGVEADLCPEAVAAVEKVTQQSFQIVIIDWEKQPEAGLLLRTARERKAAARPLTLAIVSDDASIPPALQAGANSILRKPLLLNQITDTLKTACDLLRSRLESASTAAQAAAAGASSAGISVRSVSSIPASVERGKESNLRAGEFLQSAPPAPGGQYVTESDRHESHEHSSVEPIDPLKNLEPMAASVAHEKPAPDRPAPPAESRGLEWYLKTRAASLPPVPAHAPPSPESAKPELLGFEQTSSYSPPSPTSSDDSPSETTQEAKPVRLGVRKSERDPEPEPRRETKHEPKKRREVFAYAAGESAESEEAPRTRSRFKGPLLGAVLLAGCAIVAAPQAPWHPKVRVLWGHGEQALHGWLNPQPATPVQAPVAHEDFGRAGDEYKLPAAENIPDATTDPSQIRVVPVVDPTAKKTTTDAANAEQPSTQGDPATTTPNNPTQPTGAQAPETPVPQPAPATTTPATGPVASGISTPPANIVALSVPQHSEPAPVAPVPARPAPPRPQEPHYATPPGNVPSSLKSQIVSMTPDAGGNKPVESAMQSIEPVAVPELTERALLIEQPALDYPAAARGQQGTVVLQVLIGRDGVVQDAKFMQGSLVFAKVAIDGVKLWKFKPYTMNGRPVSVQTLLTLTFKPTP
jgi:protein TonB